MTDKTDRKRKSILVGSVSVAGVAAAGIISHTVTKKLVNMALDRNNSITDGKGRECLAGNRMASDRHDSAEAIEAAKKLEFCGCEDVEITGSDGILLTGHWSKAEESSRIIIAMHGWRSSWARDFGLIADFWYENHCSVLYVEQRGQNKSGGEYMGFGLLERYDCLAWIKWINENTDGKTPIYLAGVSMGASTVMMAGGLELPDNVCGIIADCGYTSPHAIWKHVVENNLHIPYRGRSADAICRKKIQIGSKEYSCMEALKQCAVPVLFVHGTDDKFVPIEMSYENYKACAAPKQLFIVPGAGHAESYQTDQQGYESAMKDFWEKCEK